MQEPVPQGTIHLVDKDAPVLHEKVGGYLKKSPESLNPEAPHEELKRNLQAVIGSTFQENFGGTSNSVNDRTTKGRIPTLISNIRQRMKKAA